VHVGPLPNLTVLNLARGRLTRQEPVTAEPTTPAEAPLEQRLEALFQTLQPGEDDGLLLGPTPYTAAPRSAVATPPIQRSARAPAQPAQPARPARPARPGPPLTPQVVVHKPPAEAPSPPVGEPAAKGKASPPDVQRAPGQRARGEALEAPELDLTQLAQEIYPLVRRLMAIERERRPGR
jgi:hypothetical protein